jgi:multidrug efflux pump subunit AcrB
VHAVSCSASDAFVIPFAPPSIQGLGAFGGFTFEVLDQGGATNIQNLAGARSASSVPHSNRSRVTGLFSAFTANDPQLAVDIDREKARSLGLPISEITNAMQIYLGSAYVNDFDFNNRAYRVYVQADKQYRADPKALGQYYARTNSGEMVPLASVVRVRETTAPQVISISTCSAPRKSTDRRHPASVRARPFRRWSSWRVGRSPRDSATRGPGSRWRKSRRAGSRPIFSASPFCSST